MLCMPLGTLHVFESLRHLFYVGRGYFRRCGLDLSLDSGAVVIALLVTAGTRARAGLASCASGTAVCVGEGVGEDVGEGVGVGGGFSDG